MDKVIYQESTETLRVMPRNYLLAYKRDGRWIVEPDMAVDKQLAIKAFKYIALVWLNKYQMRGEYLASILNS